MEKAKQELIPSNSHFLLVTLPLQGHVNPTLHLARRLARTTGALVTFTTVAAAGYRFTPPNSDDDVGLITYTPHSVANPNAESNPESDVITKPLSSLLEDLAGGGRPVTCVIYTILLDWVADVACQHGIPSFQYWIQAATAFAIYYRFFNGYETVVTAHRNDPSFTVELPGLPPLRIRDLPSFLTSSSSTVSPLAGDRILTTIKILRDGFESLGRDRARRPKPKILVNSFDELEHESLSAIDDVDLIAIGPMVPPILIKENPDPDYIEFLDSKPERSVVYVSFGTFSVVKKEQMEEISRGLIKSGKAFLWVVRKDSRWEGVELGDIDGENNGMVVEWCSQMRVLSHRAVGCFVTHCGWNSTVESLACGVPTVGVPQWTDQATNARLVEGEWKTGVRGEINEDGVLEGGELKRCLDLVMGDGERAVEMRKNAAMWRDKARDAVGDGGSSDRNLRAFVEAVTMGS